MNLTFKQEVHGPDDVLSSRYMYISCMSSALNDFEHYEVIATPYVCWWYPPPSPKSQSVLLYLFEGQATWRQVHRMTTKQPRTLNGQRYLIYTLFLSTEFQFFRFTHARPAVFKLQAISRLVH